MVVKKEDIHRNHQTGKFTAIVQVNIEEFNPMLVKAKMEFIAGVIDSVFKDFEAMEAEYREIYGDEVIKNAHMVPLDLPTRRLVQPQDVQQKLLDTAFKKR